MSAMRRLVALALSAEEGAAVQFLAMQLRKQLGPYGSNVGYEQDRKTWTITYVFDLRTMTTIDAIQKRALDLFDRIKKIGADLAISPVGPAKKQVVVGNDANSIKIVIDLKV